VGLAYSDEDRIATDGTRSSPFFKPDWNYDLQISINYVGSTILCPVDSLKMKADASSLTCVETIEDLILHLIESLDADRILHIPRVLYHRPIPEPEMARIREVDPVVGDSNRRSTLTRHLSRANLDYDGIDFSNDVARIRWPIPDIPPKVSIVIPTRNQARLLSLCLDSIVRVTEYPEYEIILVDNGTDDRAAMRLLAEWGKRPNVRVLSAPGPFNYSALNNLAVESSQGSILCLMNNDIEAIDPGWMREMVSQALRPGIGAVGAKLLYPDGTLQHGGIILGVGGSGDTVGVASLAYKGVDSTFIATNPRLRAVQSYCAVTAACLVVRKSIYERVSGFDSKHLAVTYNDVDFCLRVEEAGYANLWTPFATLVHHESVSRGRDASSKNRERFARERGYMLERWNDKLAPDPAYNPNLSHERGDFNLSPRPRIDPSRPWFDQPLVRPRPRRKVADSRWVKGRGPDQ